MTKALGSAPSVLILCVEEKLYAKPEENFRGNFPKREVAGVPSTPGFGVMGWSARGSAPACHISRGHKQRERATC